MVKATFLHPEICVVEDFLAVDECAALIADSEPVRYEDATVNTRSGPVVAKRVRNNDRVIVDDVEQVNRLWTCLRTCSQRHTRPVRGRWPERTLSF